MDEARIAVFWSRVERRGADECWLWTASRNPLGYGHFRLEGRLQTSSRVAWWISSGEHPGTLCVLHRCDNPPCCNPAHLFLGTQADNSRDCERKGRHHHPRCERNWNAKLTREQAQEAIATRGQITGAELGRRFGVTRQTINNVRAGRSWASLPRP